MDLDESRPRTAPAATSCVGTPAWTTVLVTRSRVARRIPTAAPASPTLSRAGPISLDGAGNEATARTLLPILPNASGRPLTEHTPPEHVRSCRDEAGLSADLRLKGTRGAAATRLLNPGLSRARIAGPVRRSVRHAADMIAHYARVSPDETDAVLVKLAHARRAEGCTHSLNRARQNPAPDPLTPGGE